jgi:hypothetical protein
MECAVDFSTGNFTIVGSIQPAGGQANQLAISPRGNVFVFG